MALSNTGFSSSTFPSRTLAHSIDLALLLNRLLLVHLPDVQTDKVVGCGTASVPQMLDSIQPEYTPLTEFAFGFLQRLATDHRVLATVSNPDVAHADEVWPANQITMGLWALFCKSQDSCFSCQFLNLASNT